MRERMCRMTDEFFPRSPRSSSVCSAKSRLRMCIERPASIRSSLMPPATARRRIFWRWPITPSAKASSRLGRALASSKAASLVTFATKPFCAETGITCATGNPKISAELCRCRSICALICSGELSSSHSVSILFKTTSLEMLSESPVIRCSRHMDRSDLVTPVSAAKINTTACACGIRLTVNSGSAPIAFKPGVSKITKPCLSNGCAILISACRHRGTSISPSGRTSGLSSMFSSCQKPNAVASSLVTWRTSATFSNACASCAGSLTSRSTRVHFSGTARHSMSACVCRRVSIGKSLKQGGTSAS